MSGDFRSGNFASFGLLLIVAFLSISCGYQSRRIDQQRFATACVQGRLDTVRSLLENQKIDINSNNGRIGNCLVSASYAGHVEIVAFVLDKGANVEARDSNGSTPLVSAVVGNRVDVVRLLLERGANPNTTVPDSNGKMTEVDALTVARVKGNSEIIEMLERRKKN